MKKLIILLSCIFACVLIAQPQIERRPWIFGNTVYFEKTLELTGVQSLDASGDRGINLSMTQISTTALTGTLDGIYVRATGGDAGGAGTVRGIESGARVTDASGNIASVVTGGYFWADAKTRTATTLRGLEVSLDGGAGGTSTLAVGIEIFNNSSGTQTASYAVDINEGSPSGRKAFTADFRGQYGETISNATDNQWSINATVLKQPYDAAAYWTSTVADAGGVTFDDVSDGTARFIFSDPIIGADIAHSLFIGRDVDASGSAIPLSGAGSWDLAQGVGIYGDDGILTTLSGYTEVMTVRRLVTAAVTGNADVSTCALHTDLALNANYDGVGGLSSIWGNTIIYASKSVDLTGSLGDVSGGSFGIDIKGTLATTTHAAGVSVGVGGSGTKNGILCGYRIRGATGTVDWDGILSIEDGDGSWTNMTQAAASETATMSNGPTGTSGNPDYWLKIYIGETIYVFPVWSI